MSRVGRLLAGLVVLAASPTWAGPAHVLVSRSFTPADSDAGYAVSPTLDPAMQKALAEGLVAAGLRVAAVDQPHAYLVTVRAGTNVLCTRACTIVGHDDAPLSDYYRHAAVVAAQAKTGAILDPGGPVAWFTVLQSDGLSRRRGDYLPALLRYGARAYGRTTPSHAPPHLAPPYRVIPPDVHAFAGE